MVLDLAALPDDVAALKAMLLAEHKRAVEAEARAHDLDAEIESLKLTIAKLRHDRFGNSSERTSALMDQLELQLGELVERRAQETAAAEIAVAQVSHTDARPEAPKQRRVPARRPLPDHLPRERVVLPSPTACPCCSGRLRKLGEDVTETLDYERLAALSAAGRIVKTDTGYRLAGG